MTTSRPSVDDRRRLGASCARRSEAATRKSELRVVEDQVDAVVCAYVALFAERWPERTATYGDFETGYIVTPALPERPLERTSYAAAIQEYAAPRARARARRRSSSSRWSPSILDEAGINYLSVTGRTKGVASFAAKAGRMVDGRPAFADPLRDITDQIGVRVITYVHSDVGAVADLLGDQVVVKDDRDLGQETASEGRFGYASRHLLIALDAARESDPVVRRPPRPDRAGAGAHRAAARVGGVRARHPLQGHRPRGARAATSTAASPSPPGLLELADQEFSTIRERLRSGTPDRTAAAPDDPRIDPRELAAFLAGQYADAGWSRTDHYAWISGLLLELGIDSLDELAEVVRGSGGEDLNARMGYRYPPGAVRRLDDALLAAYGDRYVALHGNAHRVDALRARLEKLT